MNMTTVELIKNFIAGATEGKASGGRLRIENDKLINYNTTIAQRKNGLGVIINMTKYSPTTSKHQNRLYNYVNHLYATVYEVPAGTLDLQEFIKEAEKELSR